MPYRTVNFDEKWIEDLEQWLQDYPEYTKAKQFIKEAVNEKRKNIENNENQQLIQALDKILRNSEMTKQEIKQIITEENAD